MSFGFHGKILKINLSDRTSSVISISEEDVKKYFLGSGLAAKFLFFDFDIHAAPFDESNPIMFFSGLFTGGTLPGTSKMSVCSRSPLTGIWNEATVGGHWPAEFRKTGYDGFIITGKSQEKVYLNITRDKVEFRSAEQIWGRLTYEVDELIRPDIGKDARIAVIGPAGENLQSIAGIVFDPPVTRVAARSGIGAVMGSKNLKAVAVTGDKDVKLEIAHPAALKEQLKKDIQEIGEFTQGLRNFGTSGGVEAVEFYGDLPIKNWQLGEWKEGAKKVCGQAMQPEMLDRHYSCYACPIRCGKIYKSAKLDVYGHGPEYETIGMLGASCLNDDPEYVILGNEWCNKYGLDTISAGSCAGFAIEAFEKGVIDKNDTGGVELKWDGKSMLALIHMMGENKHIGRVIGMGVKHAAAVLGKNSEEFAVHTKGLEYPAHDPRGHVSMALNYATAVRGACHLEGLTYFLDRGIPAADLGYVKPENPHVSEGKPPIVVNMQNYLSVFNPLGMCKFLFIGRVGPKKISEWLRLVCGWSFTQEDVMLTGERLFNLKRVYDTRLGISRKDDVLPPRLYAGAKPDGSAKGVLPDLGNMLHEYYQLRGWSQEGIPGDEKLRQLGLIP